MNEQLTNRKTRPLRGLSDYITQDFPSDLLASREGKITKIALQQKAENLARSALERGLPRNHTGARSIARLDTMMLYTGLVHEKVAVGRQMRRLVRRLQGKGNVPVLTYEDVILSNPPSDIRTFTTGAVGDAEANFYRLHQDIERTLRPIVVKIANITKGRNLPEERTGVYSSLQVALPSLNTLRTNTNATNRDLAKSHFDSFRVYFTPIPRSASINRIFKRTYGGPSGAFSATIPALDLMTAGGDFRDPIRKYIRKNKKLMPSADRKLLTVAVRVARERRSLSDRILKGEKVTLLKPLTEPLLQSLLQFRNAHKGAVMKHLPGLMEGEAGKQGTAGIVDGAGFFGRRIAKIQRVQQQVASMK